jgi:hypothetical protein
MTRAHERLAVPTSAVAAALLFAIACTSPQQGLPGTGGDQGSGGIGGTHPSGSGGAPDGSGGMNGAAGAGGNKSLGTGGDGKGGSGIGGSHGGGGSPGTGGGSPGTGGSAGSSAAGGVTGGRGGGGGQAPKVGSPCESNADCSSNGFLTCRAPGEFLGCGSCRQGPNSCSNDIDCGITSDAGVAVAHMICDVAPSSDCYCSNVTVCQIGCHGPSDCIAGQGCNASHQCQNSCTPGDGSCPADYSCTGGFCTQNSCTDDAQCSGACVKGRCYSTSGTCETRPA